MTPRAEKRETGVGRIELALDWPLAGRPTGVACIGHPHPLYGGTMENKVTTDHGAHVSHAQDGSQSSSNFAALALIKRMTRPWAGWTLGLPHVLRAVPALDSVRERLMPRTLWHSPGSPRAAGLQVRPPRSLAENARPADYLILVGALRTGKLRMPEVRADTLVIHGEHDETIALAAVLDWARPQGLPGARHPRGGSLLPPPTACTQSPNKRTHPGHVSV